MATQNALHQATSALEVIRGAAFRGDEELFEQLAELAAPSYENALPLLRREWERCNTLYLLHDETYCLAGFHLANFETLRIKGRAVPALFSGLSALRANKKQSGMAGLLYAVSLADAMDWEEAGSGERLIVWGTTVTPTVYLGVWESLSGVNPRPDGSYAPEAVSLALSLRRHYGLNETEIEHPFVLHGVARDSLYSPLEVERLEHICRIKALQLFEVLGVESTRGDRVLFFAQLPHDDDKPILSTVWQLARRLRKRRL